MSVETAVVQTVDMVLLVTLPEVEAVVSLVSLLQILFIKMALQLSSLDPAEAVDTDKVVLAEVMLETTEALVVMEAAKLLVALEHKVLTEAT